MGASRRAFLVRSGLAIGVFSGRSALAQAQAPTAPGAAPAQAPAFPAPPPGQLSGGQSRAETTLAEISLNRAAATQLLADVQAKAVGLTVGATVPFTQREVMLRRQLADVMVAVPPPARGEYILEERRTLVEFLQQEKVPLIPPPNTVQPVVIQEPKPAPGCETVTSVVAAIILSGFGLSDDVLDVVRLIVEKVPEVNALGDDIATAVALKDAEQLTNALLLAAERIVKAAASPKRIEALIGATAWNRLKTQLALRLGTKFIPVVGQVYLGISFALTVGVNFNRLVTAVQCNARTA